MTVLDQVGGWEGREWCHGKGIEGSKRLLKGNNPWDGNLKWILEPRGHGHPARMHLTWKLEVGPLKFEVREFNNCPTTFRPIELYIDEPIIEDDPVVK